LRAGIAFDLTAEGYVRRRDLIKVIAVPAVGCRPLIARAQQSSRVRRVGILLPFAKGDTANEAYVRAFKQELEKLGWAEGRNVQFDEHWTTDDMSLVRAHATDLMGSLPDAVLAFGGRVVPILMQLSSSIPIVLPGVGDPVRFGYAKTLARPGKNVTGFTIFELSVVGKSIEILKQLAPSIQRIALIYNPDNPSSIFYTQASEAAMGQLGIEFSDAPIHGVSDIDQAVTRLEGGQNCGIYFVPDITTLGLRDPIVALVARHRLPAIYWHAAYVKIGGLVSYGADQTDLFRRSAGYVDRILRGEKPADLPFQLPTKYQLTVNLKTANALDLKVPPELLVSADEVIE
jgi:putative tryptophan/tyrosine transport system substrate-binding protein